MALVLDGAYLVGTEPPVFRRIEPPRQEELHVLVERLAERIGRTLERQGVLARDADSSHLELDPEAGGPIDDLLGHSITYRVAVGPRAGQKVFSLQTVPAREEEPRKGVAQYAGFSLHAGIGVEAEQREKLERLARYVSRPGDLFRVGLVTIAEGLESPRHMAFTPDGDLLITELVEAPTASGGRQPSDPRPAEARAGRAAWCAGARMRFST